MKRLWVSAGMILFMAVFCLVSVYRVENICDETICVLREAETLCFLGDYKGAEDSVYLARANWNRHEGFLGMALRHTEADDAGIMFSAVLEALRRKDELEFGLHNAQLMATLKELSHMEKPYLFNVL